MTKFLDYNGLSYFWEKIKAWVPFLSKKSQSIPFGQVDSTSTSTVFTATVDGITELRDGVFMYLRNGVVNSASGFTININGLGAKPVYQNIADATRVETGFQKAKTFLFAYNSTRVFGGCWDIYYGLSSVSSDTNSIGYQLRTNSGTLPAKFKTYRYRLLFTSSDGNYFVGANADTSTNATSIKTPTTEKIDPFGEIVFYGTTTAVNANENFTSSVLWQQYTFSLGYSFNTTGVALVLDYPKPVYIKCAPQTDGSAIIDATTPYVQSLPSTEDGKIYIYLGIAYSATSIELHMKHPVYYYKDGAIREWTNASETDVSGKADKVVGATNGHLAGLDSSGNLTDSGHSASDFALNSQVTTKIVVDDIMNIPPRTVDNLQVGDIVAEHIDNGDGESWVEDTYKEYVVSDRYEQSYEGVYSGSLSLDRIDSGIEVRLIRVIYSRYAEEDWGCTTQKYVLSGMATNAFPNNNKYTIFAEYNASYLMNFPLTGNVSIIASSGRDIFYLSPIFFRFSFDTGNTVPNVTWPSQISYWKGGSAPTLQPNTHYEIVAYGRGLGGNSFSAFAECLSTADDTVDISGKADKVSGATSGNFAGLDSSGNLTDSGIAPSSLATQNDISGFITNTVNDLTNYYLKSETYTKAEVEALIGAIQQFHYEIYATLPQTGQGNVLYLIGPTGTGSDKYEEYVYANNDFTKIGDTSIDLSGYVTTSALNTALSAYTTTSDLTTLLAGKLNAPATSGTSGQVLTSDGHGGQSWQTPQSGGVTDVTVGGTSVVSGGVAAVPAIPTVPTISTNIASDATSDTKTTSPKAVKTFVEGKGYGTYSKPQGGIPESDLSSDVQQALQKHFKGWYDSFYNLPSNPVIGDYAYVKGATSTDPAAIYECTTAGSWSDSGRTADTSNVQTFATGEEVNEVHVVNDLTTGGINDVLSAEQGKVLNDVVFDLLYNKIVITLDESNTSDYQIYTTSGSNYLKWRSSTAQHYYFQVNIGDLFEITANSTRVTRYAFLNTHNVVENEVADLVNGYSQVFEIPIGETRRIEIPDGCHYLYILKQTSSTVIYTPSSVEKYITKNMLEDIDVVDDLDSSDTDKPLSANQGKVLDEKIATIQEKLKGVDITEKNVSYITEGVGQNVFQGYAIGNNASIGSTSQGNGVVVNVEGAKFVKFLGMVHKEENTTGVGWFFRRNTDDTLTDSKSIYDYDTTLANYTPKEYVIAVPPTAKYFYFTVKYISGGNTKYNLLNSNRYPQYCTLIYGDYIGDEKDSIENLGVRKAKEIEYRTGDWYKDWGYSRTTSQVLRSVYPGGNINQSVWYNMPLPVVIEAKGESSISRKIELSQYPSFVNSHVVSIPINSTKVEVNNLEPQRTWYYKVYYEESPNYILNEGSVFVNGNIRQLKIGSNANEVHDMLGIDNVRDIGGYKVNGSVVKYGLIFRGRELNTSYTNTTDYLEYISQSGKDELLRLGVCMEFDLRSDGTIAPSFDGHSVIGEGVRVEFQSLIAWTRDYLNIYFSQTSYSDRYARAVRTILKYLKTGGSVYTHCTGGADRTGSLCTMLEGILGVSLNDIVLDYELSERSRIEQPKVISSGDSYDSGIRWAFEYICNLVRLPNGNTYTKCHSYRDSVITIDGSDYNRDLTVGNGKGCVTSNSITYFAWTNGTLTYYTTDKYPDLFSKLYTESGGVFSEVNSVIIADYNHTYWFDAKVASVSNYTPVVITDTELIDSLENAPATDLRDKFAIMLQLGANPLTDKEIEELRTIMIA